MKKFTAAMLTMALAGAMLTGCGSNASNTTADDSAAKDNTAAAATDGGTLRMGTLKSAVGIGGLLAMGIGDTMRVSLSADPVEEVYAARDILKAAGVRKEGPELVSCPTCGRTRIDLIGLATQVEERLKAVDKPITVAVMGCVVNGPGEASAADVGIAGGNGEGLLFRKGEIVKKVPQEALVDELFALIEEL